MIILDRANEQTDTPSVARLVRGSKRWKFDLVISAKTRKGDSVVDCPPSNEGRHLQSRDNLRLHSSKVCHIGLYQVTIVSPKGIIPLGIPCVISQFENTLAKYWPSYILGKYAGMTYLSLGGQDLGSYLLYELKSAKLRSKAHEAVIVLVDKIHEEWVGPLGTAARGVVGKDTFILMTDPVSTRAVLYGVDERRMISNGDQATQR